MDLSLRKLLEKHEADPVKQYQLAGINANGIRDFVLREMLVAIDEQDWKAVNVLWGMTLDITNEQVKVDVLNNLLVMPGHTFHQAITWEIQQLGDPSSIPYIVSVLQSDFKFLEYTYSEHVSIAKWFSHALASINTPESIAVIREYAASSNEGIAEEMKYRLERLGA